MVKETYYYELLNVDINCTIDEIKKSYKSLALKYHPDKNPDGGDKFKLITMAYETLKDPEKRKIYDNGGDVAIKNNINSSFENENFIDIFNLFFTRKEFKKKCNNITLDVFVSLEEIYNGSEQDLSINRTAICLTCNGLGGKESDISICNTCRGSGIESNVYHSFIRMHKDHRVCRQCKGTGEIIKNYCESCDGNKVIYENYNFKINIKKGTVHNSIIKLCNEGNQRPNLVNGDIIIIIKIKDHHIYKITNAIDLEIIMDLTLHESLFGFIKIIKTLDNREIILKNLPNNIINHGYYKYINNEGLFNIKNTNIRGKLLIKFNIIYPSKIPNNIINTLKECLSVCEYNKDKQRDREIKHEYKIN